MKRRQRILAALADVGLPEPEAAIQSDPHRRSGGQRQRVMIAWGLALEPALLVCDEPVSALGVSVRAQALELFAEVRRRFRLAMAFVTHDLRAAGRRCDRIAVMQRGGVVEHGATRRVLGDPQHDDTRQLIAAVPRLAARPGELAP